MNETELEVTAKIYVNDWVLQRLFAMVTRDYTDAQFESLARSWSGAFSPPRPSVVTSERLGAALDAEMASFLADARNVRNVIP